jgi:hypothetical protein
MENYLCGTKLIKKLLLDIVVVWVFRTRLSWDAGVQLCIRLYSHDGTACKILSNRPKREWYFANVYKERKPMQDDNYHFRGKRRTLGKYQSCH